MKFSLSVALLCLACELNQFEFATSSGSQTFETNNGFPINFLSDILNSAVVQKKTTSRWKWEVWDVVPGTHAYQIYIFNITNPDDVEKGKGKPTLQEVGPYYYKEYRYKFGVSMNLDLSVNFQRNYSYTFDPSHSKGRETDIVNVLNIPFIIFSTLAAKYTTPADANRAISALTASGESLIKRNVKVDDFLFHGMDVSKYKAYLKLLGPSTWLTDEFLAGLYGFLKLKNGVHEGSFTVDSGFKSEKSVGKILTYNDSVALPYWSGKACNKIEGSDGSVFPPHLENSDVLHMLEVDLCRSISFEFKEQIQFKQVVGHIYDISKDVLADPGVNKENQCFCSNSSDSCLRKGVLDVSSCQFGAPVVMSFAHFLDASPDYQEAISGLHPDPKIHQTQVTIEPVTGAVISFNKRYQWNIWVKPLAGLDYFNKYKSLIIPVLWNDDLFTLDADKEDLLMEELASQGGGMGGTGSQLDCPRSFTLILIIIAGVLIIRN